MQIMQKTAYVNGLVRTMDVANTTAEAVLVCGDRIEAVGTTAEIQEIAGKAATLVDLQGKTVYPGFLDTHSHLSLYATLSEAVYCGIDAGSMQGVLERIKAYALTVPKDRWIIGWGFDDSGFPDARHITRQELDAISMDRPILIYFMSYHFSFANTKALELCNITKETKFEGGEVGLDAQGELSGFLAENAHFHAVTCIPKADKEQVHEGILRAISHYNAAGFCSLFDGGVGLGDIDAAHFLTELTSLEEAGELNLRVRLPYIPDQMEKLLALGVMRNFGSPMVTISGAKIFNDGSIQGYTAALKKNYHDRPDHNASTMMSQEKLDELVELYHSNGYQIAFHGNGDAGIESFLLALEKAQQKNPQKDPRHVLVHCQTVSEEQLERMRTLGVIPSFFGIHVWYYGDRHYSRFLGPERTTRMNPSGSAVRLGMKHSLHVDTPVFPVLSIRSIHTAVNRVSSGGMLLGEDQRLSAEEAVRAYTSHAAWFFFDEKNRGTIEPGKFADFTITNQDMLSVAPEHIIDTEICQTIVGGKTVFQH